MLMRKHKLFEAITHCNSVLNIYRWWRLQDSKLGDSVSSHIIKLDWTNEYKLKSTDSSNFGLTVLAIEWVNDPDPVPNISKKNIKPVRQQILILRIEKLTYLPPKHDYAAECQVAL